MRNQGRRATYLALLACVAISLCSAASRACPDICANGKVDVDDLLVVINTWGPCPASPAVCTADIAPDPGNGVVNVDDLLTIINAWGTCLHAAGSFFGSPAGDSFLAKWGCPGTK